MQSTTYIDADEYVRNPCYNCPYDCPRLCDCEVCDRESSIDGDLSDLQDMDFD